MSKPEIEDVEQYYSLQCNWCYESFIIGLCELELAGDEYKHAFLINKALEKAYMTQYGFRTAQDDHQIGNACGKCIIEYKLEVQKDV